MRAAFCHQFGPPETLTVEEVPAPPLKPGHVRVGIAYGCLNFADIVMVEGAYQAKPELPFIPGMEYAGIVLECGAQVTRFAVGDRVMSFEFINAFAEQIVVPEAHLYPVPDGMDLKTAAALIVAYGTAHGALDWRARLAPGEWVLVHGAAGGVGLATVEIAKAMDATVIATASSAEKLALARAHGADYGIDTGAEDLRERVLDITGGRGVDVVIDPVGGALFDASLRAVNWRARMVIVGFASGAIPQIPANILLVKNVAAIGFWWGDYRHRRPDQMDRSIAAITEWWKGGKLHPHISHVLALEQVTDAMNLLRRRESKGRVLLEIGGE